MSSQSNWRFCTKCYSLFWYGYPTTGSCPSGGGHSPLESDSPTHAASSLNFELDIVDGNPAPGPNPGGGGGSSSAGTQGNWRFCTKCYSLFWYGYGTAGTCAAGGAHSPLESASPTHAATSVDFQLTFVAGNPAPGPNPGGGGGPSSSGTQGNWRFCTKCYSLFWYGYGTAGTCAAGGGHSPLESASPTHAATSIDFQLQIAGGAVSPPPPSSPPPPPPKGPPPPPPDDDDGDDGWDDDDGDDDDDG
jgi:hypothetical protein